MATLVEHASPSQSAHEPPWALENLPPFPVVATRLMEVLSRENADVSEVGKMISAEPVFAARVLRMANSPLFALERRVKTISHAIVVLGLARVKAITMTRALGDFVAPVLSVKALRICWQNSLAGSFLAESMARVSKVDPDTAYVAGLLRDLGRLALLVKYPGPYSNLLAVSQENSYDLMTTERDLFEIDHCQAGAWLGEHMHLPSELCEVMAYHHEPPSGESFKLVRLIHVADQLADALGFAVVTPKNPANVEKVLQELPEPVRSRFGEDPEELKKDIHSRIQLWN
jgi:HD-like signal output (HDOD) protein